MSGFKHRLVPSMSADDFVNEPDKRGKETPYQTNTNTDTGISIIPDEDGETIPAPASKPWDNFDRRGSANRVFNLRLNDYWWAILHHLGEQEEDKSMQKIVKEILLPELEKRAR